MRAKAQAVFDCNDFFLALISPSGPSGRCVALAQRGQLDLFCSTYIIDELQETASNAEIRAKFPRIDLLRSRGLTIESVTPHRFSLEEVFMETLNKTQ